MRAVKLTDLRFGWHGRIIAAPYSAYRQDDSRYKPIPAAWRNVRRILKREADAEYKAAMAEYKQDVQEVIDCKNNPGADKNTEFRLSLGWLPRHPERRTVHVPSWHWWERHQCAACGLLFFGRGSTCYCSPACYKKRRRQPRPSRAKPKGKTACAHCGTEFEQARKDARFCSVRCRVAAHRMPIA